jgi:hypothetical protein
MAWVPPPVKRAPEHWTDEQKRRFYQEQRAMYLSGAGEAANGAWLAAVLLVAMLVCIAWMLIYVLP